MKKKVISIMLVVAMLCTMFVGCGKKTTSSGNTLTVGIMQNANVTDFDDNAFTKYLEETVGVDIQFTFFSSAGSEAIQQLSLTVSAGKELPDVLLGFHEMNHYVVNQYGEDGYFIDLTKLIDKHGKNYKAALEKISKEDREYIQEKAVNTNTGEIYAMPLAVCPAYDDTQSLMYINQDWLNKLGLQAPTNIEELRKVLTAFKTQDPNGNGQPDEIPMLGGFLTRSNDIMAYLINAFVHLDTGYNFNVTDGKVWDPLVTDELRQALIYANQLVKDGLLSDMCFTLRANNEFTSLISPTDGPSKVGIFCGHPETYFNKQTNVAASFTALPALSDATGKGGYMVVSPSPVVWCSYITKDCENPDLGMKLIDALYSDESIQRARHGEKDVDWTYGEGISSHGTKAYVNIINGEAFFKGNSTWCKNPAGIMTMENYLPVAVEGEGVLAELSRLQKETWELVQNAKQPEERAINLLYSQEEYEVREEYNSVVADYFSDTINNFISGELNPNDDAEWNKYLSTMQEVGRDKLLKVAQSAYDRK